MTLVKAGPITNSYHSENCSCHWSLGSSKLTI